MYCKLDHYIHGIGLILGEWYSLAKRYKFKKQDNFHALKSPRKQCTSKELQWFPLIIWTKHEYLPPLRNTAQLRPELQHAPHTTTILFVRTIQSTGTHNLPCCLQSQGGSSLVQSSHLGCTSTQHLTITEIHTNISMEFIVNWVLTLQWSVHAAHLIETSVPFTADDLLQNSYIFRNKKMWRDMI